MLSVYDMPASRCRAFDGGATCDDRTAIYERNAAKQLPRAQSGHVTAKSGLSSGVIRERPRTRDSRFSARTKGEMDVVRLRLE
jgi:hypothetical protein